jgi:hypothetical protein
MSLFNEVAPLASVFIAFLAVVVTAWLMHRQAGEMANERNALAILEAIDKISSPHIVAAFEQLEGVNDRYPTDEAIRSAYPRSVDARADFVVGQYMETVSCLARREVLDASLIVDAVGLLIRTRWASIEPFVARQRRLFNNPYIYENFEWLAKYSEWFLALPANSAAGVPYGVGP